jgi:two-component system, response regulator
MSRQRLVLLVEDDPDDEELALMSLARHGFGIRVEVVRDGVDALDFLLRQGRHAARDATDAPAVVLLDLKLPRLGGLEVLERLRESDDVRLLPVVVMSSSREPEDISRSYLLGANSYVCKAIDHEEYGNAMKRIGEYWLEVNEPVPEGVY